jgi:NADH-quinone oxidoreductase subunit F
MDLDIVASVQENIIGHCLCVLGDSMAMPVGAMVRKFREEFEDVITAASSAPTQAKESDMDSPEFPRPGAAGAVSAGAAS